MPDFMDRVQEYQAAESEALQRSARLPEETINTALPIDRDCVGCGHPIAQQRLRAVPRAIRCIDCEEIRETRFSFKGRPR